MGKFLKEQEIIQNVIENSIETSSSEYSRFINSRPNFVTYYQRDTVESRYDKGLENVEKDIGRESPNKFNRIENTPMFGLEAMSLALNKEDSGIDTEYSGDGILVPDSIKPYPNDFFTIKYIGGIYLFKINNVTPDAIKNKPYYKVEFSLSKILDSEDKIEEQIVDNYSFLFRNIGTETKTVIKKSDFMILDYIDKLNEKLIVEFVKFFYDPRMNLITYSFNGKLIYDQFLTKFIKDEDIINIDSDLIKTIYIQSELQEDITFYESYKKTLFFALSKQDVSLLDDELEYALPYTLSKKPNDIFFVYPDTFNKIQFQNAEYSGAFKYYPETLLKRVKLEAITPNLKGFDSLILNFLFTDNYMADKTTLDAINNFEFLPDRDSLIKLPIIIFILKNLRNKLISTL